MRDNFEERTNPISYIIVIVITICIIVGGKLYADRHQLPHNCIDKEIEMETGVVARILKVDDKESEDIIPFKAKVLLGVHKNKIVQAKQSIDNGAGIFTPPEVDAGDLVILYPIDNEGETDWLFENYCRIGFIIIMGAIFLLAVVIICGGKGITTLISLAVTFAYIMAVLIPMYTADVNGYVVTLIVSAGIVFSSLFIIHGINSKSVAAVVGCWTGLIVSAFLAYWASSKMKLTGYSGEDSTQLFQMFDGKINMVALVFTITVLSSLGATMDVAMSISSSLHEVKRNSRGMMRRIDYFRSGMEIGKDTIGTMSNTLILAYMGGSIASIIIYSAMNYPISVLLNKQDLIVEFAQSIIGVSSILVTIPITAVCCTLMFYRSSYRR